MEPQQRSTHFTYTEWLNSLTEPQTRNLYRSGSRSFLRHVYQSDADPEALAERYAKEVREGGRDWFKDLLSYIGVNHDRPPLGLKTYLATIKSFLLYVCDVEVPAKTQRLIRARLPKGTRPRTIERDLSREDLQRLLVHADAKTKALVLVMVSSGVRIGDATRLRISDLDLGSDPARLQILGERTKEGDGYVTFISKEARLAVQEWLKVRDAYLKGSVNRTKGVSEREWRPWNVRKSVPKDPTALFPFSAELANKCVKNALRKAGLHSVDERTNRSQIHPHSFRKYFASQMKLVLPETVVEAFMGHTGYLDEAYRRYSIRQLGELYRKGEPYVSVEGSADIVQLQEEVNEKSEQLQTLLAGVVTENVELKKRLSASEGRIGNLEKALADSDFMLKLREELDRRAKVAVVESESS